LGDIRALRSTRPRTLPTVLSTDEVRRLLEAIPVDTDAGLIARLLYGTGMRIGECCTLRVRDVDFDRSQVVIRQAKGKKDRVVMLPTALRSVMLYRVHLRRELHEQVGWAPPTSPGGVFHPHHLARRWAVPTLPAIGRRG
jgi:integrase